MFFSLVNTDAWHNSNAAAVPSKNHKRINKICVSFKVLLWFYYHIGVGLWCSKKVGKTIHRNKTDRIFDQKQQRKSWKLVVLYFTLSPHHAQQQSVGSFLIYALTFCQSPLLLSIELRCYMPYFSILFSTSTGKAWKISSVKSLVCACLLVTRLIIKLTAIVVHKSWGFKRFWNLFQEEMHMFSVIWR